MNSLPLTVTLVGTAYPYRGGLASFNEMLIRTFSRAGKKAKIETFTVQYPSLLFPGKTQYSASPQPEDIDIRRSVNSVNPFNWIATGMRLRKERPDLIIVRYWTPFMSPCLGTICYLARRNKHTKIIPLLDNVVPHESHFFDTWLTRYFLGAIDGGIYMSQQVRNELLAFAPSLPTRFSPHPLYANYGEKVTKQQACQYLHLAPETNYLLFFGIIRDYKGLDLLIDAWKILKEKELTHNKKVIVAGEYYNNKEKYITQMQQLGVSDDFLIHDYFVKDEDVKYYFSLADVVVQPYKNATQSGVTQIAYQFEVPMIVTNVGGLAEIVPHDKVGYVTDATAEALAASIEQFYVTDGTKRFTKAIQEKRKDFTWEALMEQFESLFKQLG
ncbi:glycosyltransferase [Microbacter margulisiae]|uniref:Glycosyltransferase involved in cell wall biosynthesis n=1 Tax=Microbacter margulisiae TaxID=1350067 RepID=A0A7W5H2D8_9PORP|nr:glycosyltransferase [Microbacter margulisiae]MBB3187311.1 glycosyltransferase involved in cell wall biosynthesis [Microbacter margulisiae]